MPLYLGAGKIRVSTSGFSVPLGVIWCNSITLIPPRICPIQPRLPRCCKPVTQLSRSAPGMKLISCDFHGKCPTAQDIFSNGTEAGTDNTAVGSCDINKDPNVEISRLEIAVGLPKMCYLHCPIAKLSKFRLV